MAGFGHRGYRGEDPRAIALEEIAREIAEPGRYALAKSVQEAGVAALTKEHPGASLTVNVEFYAALVLEGVGIRRDMFSSTFALARMAGLSAHLLEQGMENKLIGPSARYVGHPPRDWAPRSGQLR